MFTIQSFQRRQFSMLLVIALVIPMKWQTAPTIAAEKTMTINDVVVTGKHNPALSSFDELMTTFIKTHQVPGASLAVTRAGQLVYARGFGYADLAKKQPVQPGSQFRVASLSKPITAVAILQLVDQGKLKLTDRVFKILKPKPFLENPTDKMDPRLQQVTILHCLQHSGGWDRSASFDPMFQSVRIARSLGVDPPADAEHVIRFMMGKPLDFDPGTRYAYSNYGYCLLGRVIEARSGLKYEQYVKQHVLAPVGVRQMRIGGSLLADRAPREVRYYDELQRTGRSVFAKNLGKKVPAPYGAWYLEAMDSHGAWIASARDLVRFAAALDQPAKSPLLKEASIRRMFARPAGVLGHDDQQQPKVVYYGCGWSVRTLPGKPTVNTWHTGSLDGTSTILVRRHDGLNWAVLFNTRNGTNNHRLSTMIDGRVHQAADAVQQWPARDLQR